MWERETEFEEVLEKGIKKTTKSSIDEVVALAIDEEKWGYKHVVGLLKKAMAKGKKDRIKVLYIISSICRKSRSQLGAKDKYAQRFTPVLPSIAKLLAEAPAEDLVQADKVLQTWQRDAVFDSYALAEFEEILKKGRASTASKHEKRKAGKQEPSQGPQGANGDIDMEMDFGITYEDDPVPPLPVAPPPSRVASSFMSQEPPPALIEQPTKKPRGSRWGVPIPPLAQPQLSVPQLDNSISGAPPVHSEHSHPRWEPLGGSAESASQQQASIAFTHPSSREPPAQPPVSSSQPLERINQEDAMKRVRELAAEFMARASKSAALEQQSHVEEPGGASVPPPPPPPPPLPLAQWPAKSAVSAPQGSQGIMSALQPSQMPPAPVPSPGPRPPASIPGPRPPPGSPPRQSGNPSQRTLPHPLPPQQPPTQPRHWPAAPPAAPPPAAPHFHSSWSGATSMDQHLSSGAPPGLSPPPPPPPPAPLPPPKFSTPPSNASPALPNGAGASKTPGSKMQEHVVPAAPPSPPKHAPASVQELAWMSANAAPQAALQPELEATTARNRGLQAFTEADKPADTIPGLDSNTGRVDNASEEDWWTTVTSSLPNLDSLMSPS